MNNDDNTCGSINVEGYLKTRNTVDEYDTKYKQKIQQYIEQEVERTKKIFEKYKITWYGISGYEYGTPVCVIMKQLEDDMEEEIFDVDVIKEDCDVNELINKIKQGKIKIKKSK